MQNYHIKEMKDAGKTKEEILERIQKSFDVRMRGIDNLSVGEGESVQELYGADEDAHEARNFEYRHHEALECYLEDLFDPEGADARRQVRRLNRIW